MTIIHCPDSSSPCLFACIEMLAPCIVVATGQILPSLECSQAILHEQAGTLRCHKSSLTALNGHLSLRANRVTNDHRTEPTGLTDNMRDRLNAARPHFEIAAWKMQVFLAMTEEDPAILDRLTRRSRPLELSSRN